MSAEGVNPSAPLRLVVPLPICLEHQKGFDPQDFLLDESRDRLCRQLLTRGKAMPDFDSAWVEWHHLGDRDWQKFHGLGRRQ